MPTVVFTTAPVDGPAPESEDSLRPEERIARRVRPAATSVAPPARVTTTAWMRARCARPRTRTAAPFTRTRAPMRGCARAWTVRTVPDFDATARLLPLLPTTTPVNVPANAPAGNAKAAATAVTRMSFFIGLSFFGSPLQELASAQILR